MRSRTRARAIATVLGAGALGLVALPSGAAAEKDVKTKLEIRYEGVFEGTVSSAKAACETRRKVTLYEVRSGKDKALDSDRTSKNSDSVSYPGVKTNSGRKYYLRTEERNPGNLRCSGATSAKINPI